MRTMTKVEWQPLADAHAAQVDAWSEGRRTRRGMRHPIDDFLWDYYSHRPAHLRRWHPGTGIALEAAAEHATWPHYVTEDGVTFANPNAVQERRHTFEWIRELLVRTRERQSTFACFGLHEWAMVYGLEQHEVRHEQAPLRLVLHVADGQRAQRLAVVAAFETDELLFAVVSCVAPSVKTHLEGDLDRRSAV